MRYFLYEEHKLKILEIFSSYPKHQCLDLFLIRVNAAANPLKPCKESCKGTSDVYIMENIAF